jgi:hypothetical protein
MDKWMFQEQPRTSFFPPALASTRLSRTAFAAAATKPNRPPAGAVVDRNMLDNVESELPEEPQEKYHCNADARVFATAEGTQ